jgi:hypothetical protein
MSHLAFNPTNGHLIWHSTSGHLCYKSIGDCAEVPDSEKVEMQIVSLTGVIWYHDAQIVSWPGHELPPPGSKDWTYFIPSMFPFSLPYQADCVWLGYSPSRRLELIDNTYWKLTFTSGSGWSERVLFEARKYSGNSPVGPYTVVESSRQYPYGADYGISHTVNNIVIAKA